MTDTTPAPEAVAALHLSAKRDDFLFNAVQDAMLTALDLPQPTQGRQAMLAAISRVRNLAVALAADRDAQKARADAAEQERDALIAARDAMGSLWAQDYAHAAAEAKVARLVEGLEFYADRSLDGYDVQVTDYGLSTERGAILQDGGDIARAIITEVQG